MTRRGAKHRARGSRRARARARRRCRAASSCRACRARARARRSPSSASTSAAPSACATAQPSSIAPTSSARSSGVERISPSSLSWALVVQASAFRRTSFDHITSASESPAPRAETPASLSSVGESAASRRARPGRALAMLDEQERARVDDDAGLGPVGLDADRAGEHRARRRSARAARARWSRPLSSGSTSGGSTLRSARARPRARRPWWRRSARRPARRSCGDRARAGDEVAEQHAVDAQSALADRRGRRLPGDDERRRCRRARARPRAGRPRRRDRARRSSWQGIDQHAGFIIPRGSTAAFAPRSAAANGSGRWRSYQGR